ncbi:diguanylate cyclase [Paenibacillus sp. alder61]|uniref:GGDEF domain-containing protein n=1 Tax=Paenibacillus sp. alder61 TaxID=2862948 RepID=UPI001CD31AA9|nr:diguanylate cyclase [Paenibacillus sp. alder61]MCA1296515.1 diguanylate cyclase [Paenibacillus sp. alder61]
MLQSLINNFTALTTFLFLGYIVWSKWRSSGENGRFRAFKRQFLLGSALGLFGVSLMYISFPLNSSTLTDLRQLPILISVSIGGWAVGGITTLIIGTYRLFFLNGFTISSMLGSLDALLTYVIAICILREYRLSLRRWNWAVCLSAIVTAAVFYYLLEDADKWVAILVFILIFFTGGLFTFSMLTYLKRSNESLRMMREAAHRDFLTGLFNARAFEFMMEQKTETSNRSSVPFTLLMLDIDYFKRVNDTYGHPAGDAVLAQMADVLRGTFRPGDHIARKGGEEFAVIVDACDSEQIRIIAERLRRNVENHVFRLPEGTEIHITVSAGSATYPDIDSHLLVDRADRALYEAKATGRNRVCRATLPSPYRFGKPMDT